MTDNSKRKLTISGPKSLSHESHVGFQNIEYYKEKYNFDEFMMNPSSLIRKYFKQCLEKQYCAEGFYFHESVESYRSLKTEEEFKNHAFYIRDTFIVTDAKYEANTSGKLKNEALRLIEEGQFTINLFDKMDADILFNIRIETYEKFLHSEDFQEFLKEKDDAEIMNERVINKKDLELFLKSTTSQSSETPKSLFNLKSSLIKSLQKKSTLASPRVRISGPTVDTTSQETTGDYTDIFNFEEVLKDKNNGIRSQFVNFLEKSGSEINLLYLHEHIEKYKFSNPNFIFSIKDIGQKGVSKASNVVRNSLESPKSSPKDEVIPKIPPRRGISDAPKKETPKCSLKEEVMPKIPPRRTPPNPNLSVTKDTEGPKIPPRRNTPLSGESSSPKEEPKEEMTELQKKFEIMKKKKLEKESKKKSISANEKDEKAFADDYKSIALKIKQDFFKPKGKYYIKREELHIVDFDKVEYQMDTFNQLDSKVIKILQKEHFGNFVKSPEFIKLLNEIPDLLIQTSPRNSNNVVSPRSKHSRMKSLTQTPNETSPRNTTTPRGNTNSGRSKSPFQESLVFEEEKKEGVFQQLMKDPKCEYRKDFKKYLDKISASQLLNLHESIEFYRVSSEADRKIQSVVLQKIIGASPKTKNLLNQKEMKKMSEKFKESPVDLFDELDVVIIETLKKNYFSQYYMVQCQNFNE
eukprot:gene2110-1977_t